MFEPILVEEIKRSSQARRTTIKINKKLITTPFYGTILQRKFELELLCKNHIAASQNFQMIVMKIHDAETLLREKEGNLGQKRVNGKESEHEYAHLKRSKVWLIDPCTDEYPYPGKGREPIENFGGYSTEIQKLIKSFTDDSHSIRWQNLHEDSTKFMKFIKENCTLQQMMNTDVVVPPSPLIRANDPKYIVDVWYDVVKTTGIYAKTNLEKSSSILLNLHFNNFKNTEKLEMILEKLMNDVVRTEIADVKLIIVKIKNPNFEGDTAGTRNNFKRFMIALGKYASLTKRTVFLLNTDSLGLISIALGIDGFVEPLNGVIGGFAISHIKKGRYYHPEGLKFIPYTEIYTIYQNCGKLLPCNCHFCSTVNGRELNNVGTTEWNLARRGHLLVKRGEEINECHIEINKNTISGSMNDKVMRSDTKNYLDILPNNPR